MKFSVVPNPLDGIMDWHAIELSKIFEPDETNVNPLYQPSSSVRPITSLQLPIKK